MNRHDLDAVVFSQDCSPVLKKLPFPVSPSMLKTMLRLRSTPPLLGNRVKSGSYEHTQDCEHLLEWVGTMAIHRRLLNDNVPPGLEYPCLLTMLGYTLKDR